MNCHRGEDIYEILGMGVQIGFMIKPIHTAKAVTILAVLSNSSSYISMLPISFENSLKQSLSKSRL